MPVERNIRDILQSGESTLLEADMSRRLDMLVRQGMLPVAKLPLLKRGLEKMKSGKVGTPQERDAVSNVLDQMMYIILGDDTVFQKARQHTQKNRYQTEESEIETAEESDDVTLNEWEELLLDIQTLEEKNVPTNPKLWSKYKSQAKAKFDVYPSAYANGWAAKMYKKAGGSWKSVSEDVEQVDEVSSKMLASYQQKNETDREKAVGTQDVDKIKKRVKGDRLASKKRYSSVYKKYGLSTAKVPATKEEVELEEKLETERIKHPVGKRPQGIGWTLKQAGEQTGKDHSVWERKFKKVKPTNEEVELEEKVEDMEMGEVIKDFQKSDAPQFKGKSKEKRREMAIAAKLSKEETEEETTVDMNNPFAAAKKARIDEYRVKNPASEAEDSRQRAKKAAERLSRKVAKTEKETDPGLEEGKKVDCPKCDAKGCSDCDDKGYQLKEYITGKQVKMAKGIANDPRHKGGDMTGAAKKMEKIKKGLSNHPGAQKALRTANEGVFDDYSDEELDELLEMDFKAKFQTMLKKSGKSLGSMSPEEKKKFFNSVDAAHTAKNENYTMKNDYAKSSGAMSKDKASHNTGGMRISNKDAGAAKARLMKKKGITEDAASDAKRDYDADDKKGLAPTKKDKPAKVSDASNAKEIEHIVPQMRKAITVGKEVQFQDGKTHKISKGHAAKFLNKYMNSKPADKQTMQTSAHKSHDHFKKHV
jgi:hypothetical protein